MTPMDEEQKARAVEDALSIVHMHSEIAWMACADDPDRMVGAYRPLCGDIGQHTVTTDPTRVTCLKCRARRGPPITPPPKPTLGL